MVIEYRKAWKIYFFLKYVFRKSDAWEPWCKSYIDISTPWELAEIILQAQEIHLKH